jgi:hypothetical protein
MLRLFTVECRGAESVIVDVSGDESSREKHCREKHLHQRRGCFMQSRQMHRETAILSSLIVWLATHAAAAAAQLFTQPFDPSTNSIQVKPGEKHGVFRATDEIRVETANGAPLRVFTRRGETVYEGPPAALPKMPPNHYFVETTGDRTQFVVLPADYHGVSFLGTEADDGKLPWNSEKLDRIRPGWSRAVNEGNIWADVQPTRDRWNWQALDRTIEISHQNRRTLLLTAWLRPKWLTDDKEFTPLYCEYLRQLCRRYGDKLYAIEIWNEPNSRKRWPKSAPLWIPFENAEDDVPAAYVNLLREAYPAIKSVNPNIKVFGPGWGTPVTQPFIEKFARLGGPRYLDGFTFHDYYLRDAAPDARAQLRVGYRPRIDQIVQRYRLLLGDKELVMDEGGLFGHSALGIVNTQVGDNDRLSELSWERALARTIKYVVMYRAENVQALIPHIFTARTKDAKNNHELFGWELNNRGPHPKTSAFIMTCHTLEGARLIEKRILNNKLFLYAWQRPDGHPLVFAWCVEGHSAALRPTQRMRATDVFGHEVLTDMLGEEPVLFHQATVDAIVAALEPK